MQNQPNNPNKQPERKQPNEVPNKERKQNQEPRREERDNKERY